MTYYVLCDFNRKSVLASLHFRPQFCCKVYIFSEILVLKKYPPQKSSNWTVSCYNQCYFHLWLHDVKIEKLVVRTKPCPLCRTSFASDDGLDLQVSQHAFISARPRFSTTQSVVRLLQRHDGDLFIVILPLTTVFRIHCIHVPHALGPLFFYVAMASIWAPAAASSTAEAVLLLLLLQIRPRPYPHWWDLFLYQHPYCVS